MTSSLRSLLVGIVLVVLVPRCDSTGTEEPRPCGACGESCSTWRWDPESRTVREYSCKERDGSHECSCDGQGVNVRTADCSEALRRGCGLISEYGEFCDAEGVGLCFSAPDDAGAAVWQCECASGVGTVQPGDIDCERALFHGCPLSCASEHGGCASGEETFSFDCTCANGRATRLTDYLLRYGQNCDSALARACEPACSSAIGRCFDLGERHECLCGAEERLETIVGQMPCESAMLQTCAGRDFEGCSHYAETGYVSCDLDGDGYRCACASYDADGDVALAESVRVGQWQELDGAFVIDIECEQALRDTCPAAFEDE